MIIKDIQSAFAVGLGVVAFAATVPVAHAQTGIEEVFVTARKRDEGAQSVPISISALSSEALEQRNVREVQDLNVVVPGFRFGSSGGKGTNDVVMRGLSKIPLGDGVAAVVTYFANIALPSTGSNIPAYDIANIQVFKGPQGTLFGRNTLGGAVVITPEAPSFTPGGYLRGAYGTKEYRALEGAVNVPLVDDKVALRVAGQLRRQDGMNKNLSGGDDFDNIHQNSYRISLLLQPTENLESTTVYDHFTANERASAGYLMGVTPALAGVQGTFDFLGSPFSPIPGVFAPGQGTSLAQQINSYVAAGHKAGIHAAFSDLPDNYLNRNIWGVANDTAWNISGVTLRNIFGYRRSTVNQADSSSGLGPMTINMFAPPFLGLPAGTQIPVPFTAFTASQPIDRKYLSDEFQVFGNAFDDKLDWIVGAFYNLDQSAGGDNGTQFTIFSPGAVPAAAITSHVKNENKAIFAQMGLDISQWTLEGLKFNVGARYSKDDVWACGGGNAAGYIGVNECKTLASTNNPFDGIGILKNDGNEVSWTAGLDWQLSPDTLVYIASRHGYRGVNVNTPMFETPYTTGGNLAQVMASPLGPLLGPCNNATFTCPDLRAFQKTKPEKITDVEVGVKNDWNIGDVKGRINVAAYITKYKDAVQFVNVTGLGIPNGVPDAPTSSSVGVNAADLTIKGVEADLTVIPVPSLTLTLSGAYTDQTVDSVSNVVPGLSLTKNQITLPSPKFSGTFAFNWTLPVHPLDGDVILNGDYYHTDKFGGQEGISLPGYDVANFRINWNNIGKSKLALALYVKNAFDEEYFTSPKIFVSAFPVQTAMPADPRTWGVEASYKF